MPWWQRCEGELADGVLGVFAGGLEHAPEQAEGDEAHTRRVDRMPLLLYTGRRPT